MTRLFAGLAAGAVAALLGWTAYSIYAARADDPFAPCRNGTAGGGDIGGPFTLVGDTGQTVTDAQVIIRPSLVYFGYTSCVDVCPLDNARNAEATDILEEMGYAVTPVFISIDPARDTPQVMAAATAELHPRMIGLTGSAEQIKTAAQAYKVYYKKQSDEKDYQMDHSTFTYLMLPVTGFAGFFTRDTSADQIADRVACFLDAR